VIRLESALRRIVVELNELRVSFALVGGLAVSIRTEPRFTKDADLAVALTSDSEAESLVRHLTTLDYRVAAVIEQEAVGRLATVRLSRADRKNIPIIDLLFASSGIEPEIVAEAELVEVVSGVTLGVARTGHLIALKMLARDDIKRPLDLADLRALLLVASDIELTRARDALTLITTRGYHRGRSLLSEFDALTANRNI
jgi:predicted nucleotidyltransferase